MNTKRKLGSQPAQLSIGVPRHIAEDIDLLAGDAGLTRTEWVREAIDHYLGHSASNHEEDAT